MGELHTPPVVTAQESQTKGVWGKGQAVAKGQRVVCVCVARRGGKGGKGQGAKGRVGTRGV